MKILKSFIITIVLILVYTFPRSMFLPFSKLVVLLILTMMCFLEKDKLASSVLGGIFFVLFDLFNSEIYNHGQLSGWFVQNEFILISSIVLVIVLVICLLLLSIIGWISVIKFLTNVKFGVFWIFIILILPSVMTALFHQFINIPDLVIILMNGLTIFLALKVFSVGRDQLYRFLMTNYLIIILGLTRMVQYRVSIFWAIMLGIYFLFQNFFFPLVKKNLSRRYLFTVGMGVQGVIALILLLDHLMNPLIMDTLSLFFIFIQYFLLQIFLFLASRQEGRQELAFLSGAFPNDKTRTTSSN